MRPTALPRHGDVGPHERPEQQRGQLEYVLRVDEGAVPKDEAVRQRGVERLIREIDAVTQPQRERDDRRDRGEHRDDTESGLRDTAGVREPRRRLDRYVTPWRHTTALATRGTPRRS